jgi:threonine dehydrogenase-like Zn-dependent dehydrogenase
MKALLLTGPGEARVADVGDQPEQEGVLLQVDFVGLCGSDLNSFRGTNPLITYPRVLGHEVAATIVSGAVSIPAGTPVTLSPYSSCGACAACRAGRINTCRNNQTLGVQRDGALRESLRIPEEKLFTGKLSLKELCLVEPLSVGFHAVNRGRVTANDTVAVIGCGGVGLGAVSASNYRGARTIAVDMSDQKLETAKLAGATDTINTTHEHLAESLALLTNGHGPNVVIEAIGLPQTFRAAVDTVAVAGRVVYIGYAKQPVSYETRLFVQKELDILGSRNALPADFREVIAMLEAGRFPVDSAIGKVVSLEETPEVLREWAADPARFGKIMVQMSSAK